MNVLIVYAHPEPNSFNGALKDVAIKVLEEQGHQVKVSDLYAMNFNPVASKEDFLELENNDFFKYQAEQIAAVKNGTFTDDIYEEIIKLKWADFVLFQFPLWWLSVPAILKGWVDRVFAMGWLYGPGVGFYDQGGLKGKKTLVSVTTGGPGTMFSKDGISGDIMDQVLHPIHRGILSFSGMEVLPPFVAYGAAHNEENRKKYLNSFIERLLTIETTPSIPYHPNSHYDSSLQLKPEYIVYGGNVDNEI